MGGEWKEWQIRQVSKVMTGKTPPGTLHADFNGDTLFVTPTDMRDSKYIRETARTLSPSGRDKLNRILFSNGIVVSCIGWQMGKSAIVNQTAVTNQQINTVLPNEKIIDLHFLYYVLNSKRSEIFNLGATATRTPILKKSLFEKITFKAPPLPEQKAIAHILGTLDDKIELNRQMNATLEAMAQALFKSWFVDFDPVIDNALRAGNPIPDELTPRAAIRRQSLANGSATENETNKFFPSSFQHSKDLGWIPDGWTVCPLYKKIRLLSGGTPKTSEPMYWNGDIPWYSVRDVPNETDIWVIFTEKHVTKLGIENSAAQIFPEKTTIISARGTVGKLALTAVPMAMNQSCYGIRSIDGYGEYFTYYRVRESTAQLQQRTHGTVFDTITTDTFKKLDCIFPAPNITVLFDKHVEPLLEQIRANLHQSRTLAIIRDTLLPKLLSGGLSVSDFNLKQATLS